LGSRHYTRQLALQALYALDANPALTVEESLFAVRAESGDAFSRADHERLTTLVEGVHKDIERIDDAVEAASRNWKLPRMDRVDRSILRLGTFELTGLVDVPAPVILSEAVELAKDFGSTESPAFINGILDRVARNSRPDEVKT